MVRPLSPHTRRLARTVLLVCLTVCAPAVPEATAAQKPAPEEYLALVDAYWTGDARAAVQDLSERDDRWVESAEGAAQRGVADWPPGRIEAAVLLHTEVVAGGWVLPAHVPMHLQMARRYVEVDRGRRVSPQFRHDWLLAVCWHFQSELELGAVVPWLDELRNRYPGDGEALLAQGIFYEALGWTDTPPPDMLWTGGSRTLAAVPHHSRREALQAAADALQRAAAVPATRAHATVRLGRVLAELNRTDAARAALVPMLNEQSDRRWRYLAALFTALAEGHAGRPGAQAAAYERAAATMDGCQTPLVGLTTLYRLLGQADRAAASARALATEPQTCDDPWWFYRFGQPPDRLPELLATMRRALAP